MNVLNITEGVSQSATWARISRQHLEGAEGQNGQFRGWYEDAGRQGYAGPALQKFDRLHHLKLTGSNSNRYSILKLVGLH